MSIDKFSEEVCNEIGYYVYGLIDPRNGQVFYVGKGKDNRIFDHIKDELKYEENEDSLSEKIKTIRTIKNAGLEVIHIIYRHHLTNEQAEIVEATLIDYIPGLSNEVKGKGSSDYGITNAKILNTVKEPFEDRCDISYMIIKIRQSSVEEKGLYEAVRSAWVVSKEKVDKIPYVLAVVDGVVKEVYKVHRWEQATYENSSRYEFTGEEETGDVAGYFKNKRIPDDYRKKGSSNPVLYPPHLK